MRLIDPASGSPGDIDRYLLPTEQQQQHIVVRQHPVVLAGPIFTVLAGLAAATILAQAGPPGNEAHSVAWFVWGVLLLRLVLKSVSWSIDYFVVTSARILMVTGILTRSVAIIPFSLVNDLDYHRSPAGRLLGYGEFLVRYGAQNQVLQRIQYIVDPERLHLQIHRMLITREEAAVGGEQEA